MRPREPLRVPRYLVPVARHLAKIEKAIHKGILLQSPTVFPLLQPDGRVLAAIGGAIRPAVVGGTSSPGPSFASAFTEFYCDPVSGNNLNAGSTQSGSAAYSTTNGNWSTVTNKFTVTDGTNPSLSVAIGDWVSIYLDGASVAVFIARVTAVDNSINGAITVSSTATAGTAPTTGATGRSLKAGGAWKGPNGAQRTPFNMSGFSASTANSNGDRPRINLKNNASYLISVDVNPATNGCAIQGYTTTPGDGGRATIDGGTNSIVLFTEASSALWLFDLIFKSSATAGTNRGVVLGQGNVLFRVTVTGARGSGFVMNSFNIFIECEANACNISNSSGAGGYVASSECSFLYCVALGNPGSNTDGFIVGGASAVVIENCISAFNGRHGFSSQNPTGSSTFQLRQCDAYRNTGDGYKNLQTTNNSDVVIANCNFILNAGYGINSSITTGKWYGIVVNCGFGAGTMANTLGSTGNVGNLTPFDCFTYPDDLNPYASADSGNFTIIGTVAAGGGRGVFTETQSYSGTAGTPNVGAA